MIRNITDKFSKYPYIYEHILGNLLTKAPISCSICGKHKHKLMVIKNKYYCNYCYNRRRLR